jgi:hypothetical protein
LNLTNFMNKYLPPREFKFLALVFLLAFSPISLLAQTTYTWVGGVSTDFYNVNNWDNTSIDFANLNNSTLIVGVGMTNNPINVGFSGNDVIAKRAGYFNTNTGANLIITGTFFPNNNTFLNGTITLNGAANFSNRNYAYLGKGTMGVLNINSGSAGSKYSYYIGRDALGHGTINVNGGGLYVGTYLEVGTGTGNPTGVLNISGGTVDVVTAVNIGTNGSIYISGIGQLVVTGNKTTNLQAYINAGKITCPVGKTIVPVFDGLRTTVSIPQDPNSLLREYPGYVILNNGLLEAKIEKGTGNILSMKVGGKETISQTGSKTKAYYDFTSSKGFETMYGATFSVKEETTDYIDISFKRPYVPSSNLTPCDADIHYVLKKNDTGLYTYSILEHKTTYPDFDLGSWRQVMWIANDGNVNLAEKIYVTDQKKWEMPSIIDYASSTPTGIQEIIKINTGARAGKYDGKYEYSEPLIELPAYGHASDINQIGSWAVFGSHEYFNSGPSHHDLNAAAGIIHICMNGVHYNSKGFVINAGEAWSKIYGPYLLYTSTKATGDLNWADAKARAAVDKAEWPFSWLTNTPQYPLANQRGNIIGNFVIDDPYLPTITGKNAWIGVTKLSNDSEGQWQFEEENYQYWVKTDASGNFDIKNVRPGTYTLFAYSDGVTGEFSLANVTVTANSTNNLGTLIWTIVRSNGNLIWEIGTPNRTASEYKFGDFDYAQGYVQDKFAATFTNPIEYKVTDKNWATALPYVHSSYFKTDGTRESWKWRLNFNLPVGIPTTGNAKLTIAYASADHAQQWIYVNNESATPIMFYPPISDGNAFLRQSNHAKYTTKVVDIPMSKLKSGANTITMLMPSTSSSGNHLMYDYISLEGDPSLTLPVALVSFNAKADGSQAKLNWITSSEKNNERFDVLRSIDGKNFKLLGSVKGKGNSNGQNQYSFNDDTPLNGVNYYQLIQYDFNGQPHEHGIKAVNFSLNQQSGVSIYPNPASDYITVSLLNTEGQNVKISIASLLGKVILEEKFRKNDTSTYTIQITNKLEPGTYIVNINAGSPQISTKLIIK